MSKYIPWFFLLLYVVLMVPFFSLQSFTDEYEHAMAGWFLLNGLLPYRDYFSHHAPLPLFLGVLGFVLPRIDPILVLRAWILAFHIGVWAMVLKLTSIKFRPVIYLTMLLTALSTPTFLLQMALTDTLVSLSLLFLLILLLHRWLYRNPSPMTLVWTFGGVSVFCLWSTVAAVLPLVVLLLGLVFTLIYQRRLPSWKKLVAPLSIISIFHLVFPLVYILLGSFHNFWWSVFTYNTEYYFPLRLAQTVVEREYGPLFQIGYQFWLMITSGWQTFSTSTVTYVQAVWGGRTLLLTTADTWVSYQQLITQVYLQVVQPINLVLSVVAIGICVYFLLTRKWGWIISFIFISVSLFFRSNEIFHLSPLYLWEIVVLSWLWIESVRRKQWLRISFGIMMLALILHNLIPTYISVVASHQPYLKPEFISVSQHLQQMTDTKDRIQVMNMNMVYYPLARRLPACRYHYYLPWLHQTPIIQAEMKYCLESAWAKAVIIPNSDESEMIELMPLIDMNYVQTKEDSSIYLKHQ